MPGLSSTGDNMTDVQDRGRLLVCFDFEGGYGMPHEVPFDVRRSAGLILDELARHEAQAVFFIVGRMVEDHPDVVQDIANAGHEIGLHGYEHDDLSNYDAEALALLDKNLARVGSLVEDITGSRPQCFRAPYLLAPHFYRAEVYAMLRAQGFRWVSNREIRYPAQLRRPGLFLYAAHGGRATVPRDWPATGCCLAHSTRDSSRKRPLAVRRLDGCGGCSVSARRSFVRDGGDLGLRTTGLRPA